MSQPKDGPCSPGQAYLVSRDDLERTPAAITENSWYAWGRNPGRLPNPAWRPPRRGIADRLFYSGGGLKTIRISLR